MPDLQSFALGLNLLVSGALLLWLVLLVARVLPRIKPLGMPARALAQSLDPHHQAVLLIHPGGRVVYLNQQAREWFNSWERSPDLERLASRTRPSAAFLSLCAGEGQASLWLSGQAVEGSSYLTPIEDDSAVMVTLRRKQWAGLSGADEGPSGQIETTGQQFRIFSQLNQSITASLDMEDTLVAILEGTQELIAFDSAEISVWSNGEGAPEVYRLAAGAIAGDGTSGDQPAGDRLENISAEARLAAGYSSLLHSSRQPLLVADANRPPGSLPSAAQAHFAYSSYLGLPLEVAGEAVGSLELVSNSSQAFHQSDLDLLQLFSGQMATAINNAKVHQAEQKRARELTGLASLAQAINAPDDPQDLYARLVETIQPLLDAEILGFLVYDPQRQELRGQAPFAGLAPEVVEAYHATLTPGSPSEQVWLQQSMIVTADASTDPQITALGLHDLQRALCIRQTALVPLISAGRCLGYLQAANRRNGEPFQNGDLHLLEIIAGQAAVVLANATLVQESRRRAQRAETLRRIASLASSSATLEEILKFSLLDLARLLQADIAAIYKLDRSQAEERLDQASAHGLAPEDIARFSRLFPGEAAFAAQLAGSQPACLDGNLIEHLNALPVFRPMIEGLKIASAIVVPLIVRQRGLGEIFLGSFRVDGFNPGDLLSASTAAGLLAAAIEQSSLASQTDQDLRLRVEQMTALTRISRELNTTLDLEHLLRRVLEEAVNTTGASCGTIFLLDLEAGHRSPPRILLQFGDLHTPELDAYEQAVLGQGESWVVGDFSSDTASKSDESPEGIPIAPHKEVRSALVVPIAYQDQVAGLLHLHSPEPHHFDQGSRQISEALAVQAAIAIGNAHRYHDQVYRSELLNRRVETLSRLFEASRALQAEQPLEQALEAIAGAIQSATPFDIVLISVYDPQSNDLLRSAQVGIPLAMLPELNYQPLPWQSIENLLRPEFQTGRCYFIPHELKPAPPDDLHSVTISPFSPSPVTDRTWHPDDLLLVPLLSSGNQILGLITVDGPRDRLRPDRPSLETLEIFATQAAILIESRQVQQDLYQQVDQLTQALEEAQNQVLRLQDREQQDLAHRQDQATHWVSAGLQIAEAANRQTSREGLLRSMADALVENLGMQAALVAEACPGGLRLVHATGDLPPQASLEALLGQRNPLKHSLQTGDNLVVAALEDDLDWHSSPLLRSLGAGSFVCLPVSCENRVAAAILATHATSQAGLARADSNLLQILTRQASAAYRTLELAEQAGRRMRDVDLLLDFSRQLDSLSPDTILNTMVEHAVSLLESAQAGMVAVWDPSQQHLVPRATVGYADPQRLLEMTYRAGEALPGQAFEWRAPICVDEVDAARHFNLDAGNLQRYHDATGGQIPVACLVMPVVTGAQEQPLGVLALENFTTPAAFTPQDQALVASLVQQASLALENASLFAQTRSLMADLEQRVAERTAELASEHQRTQILLRILTELSASLDLDQVLRRTLSILNEVIDAGQITVLITRPGEPHLLRLASVGYAGAASDGDTATPFGPDEGLAGWSISHREPVLVPDLAQDPRWIEQLGDFDTHHRSALVVPLMVGAEALGVLLLYHPEVDHFVPAQLDLVVAAANQVAIAVNNAELYRLLRDQAEDLGALLRKQQEQTSRSQAILEAVANGVLVTDAHKQITLFNAAAEEILGLPRSQVVGKSLEHFSGLFGGTTKLWRETIQAWSQNPLTDHLGEPYTEKIALENGRVLQVHMAPVIFNQDFLGTVSIFEDITHQVEVDRLKSEFVATASHELRTPLTSIKGYADILLMGACGGLNAEQASFLKVIKANAERLSVLVADLLSVSQAEAGKIKLSVSLLDLPEMVNAVLGEAMARSKEDGKLVEFACEAPPNLPRVHADPERVHQILENLLNNAYRYNLPNGRVVVRMISTGAAVQVDVQDTGMGVPLEEQPHLFERFFRGENPLVLGVHGTGLGLCIVKDLVQMHGGEIWMKSTGVPGEGSTFSFTLPVYRPDAG